jgi:hypothetical protein
MPIDCVAIFLFPGEGVCYLFDCWYYLVRFIACKLNA